MITFDEDKQKKKIEDIRKREEEELAQILSGKYGVSYMDLSRVSINTDALRLIPETEARTAEVALYHKLSKKLFLAVRSPNKPEVHDIIKELEEQGYSIEMAMVSRASLGRAWEMYKDLSFAVETQAGVIDISGEEVSKLLDNLKDLEDVRAMIKNVLAMKKSSRISRIVEVVLAGAVFSNSSDIHIEPEAESVRLRYRLDGVLADILNINLETYKLILSRIKLISGLLLNVRDSAQDGRFSITIRGVDIEVRTSVLPNTYGESIVLRLLNPDTIALSLEDLGIENRLYHLLIKEIHKPNGMLITTGPTGSGKTTSLYAFLKKVHTPDIKIITIEDPVEYRVPGIVQTQVDKKKYTFAEGLRASLRQDPDIIMIGEIRDEVVAQTAIQSALTGHFVFSTLHTNNAAGAIPRLIDLGINPKIIGSALNVTMAQRLVRLLCPNCKVEVELSESRKKAVSFVLNGIVLKENIPKDHDSNWEAKGCDKCNDSGYKGRLGIYEAIIMDEQIEKLTAENPSEREIVRAARPQGVLSMREDGVLKMLRGVTSFSELERVVALDDETDQAELDRIAAKEKV